MKISSISVDLRNASTIMAKKRKVGRPKGSDKEPMNIYVHKERAAKLRKFAEDSQKTISVVVENALEAAYQI